MPLQNGLCLMYLLSMVAPPVQYFYKCGRPYGFRLFSFCGGVFRRRRYNRANYSRKTRNLTYKLLISRGCECVYLCAEYRDVSCCCGRGCVQSCALCLTLYRPPFVVFRRCLDFCLVVTAFIVFSFFLTYATRKLSSKKFFLLSPAVFVSNPPTYTLH